MILVTRRQLADTAAKRWAIQYPPDAWPEKQKITKALFALGDNPDPEAVDAAIGNDSWTTCLCDHCNERVPQTVRLGHDPYESFTVCGKCLLAALELTEENS